MIAGQARAERWLEIQLIPVSAQVNVLETEHVGSGARLTYFFNRFIGVYAGGLYNWHAEPSAALLALWELERLDVSRPYATLASWQVHAGLESIPLTGTFALGAREGTIGLVATAGLGPGGSHVRLETLSHPDAGVRLMGHFGLGMRFALGPFAVHAGIHASMWSSMVTQLNGCSSDDLRAMEYALRGGQDPSTAAVGPSCRGFASRNDIPLTRAVFSPSGVEGPAPTDRNSIPRLRSG